MLRVPPRAGFVERYYRLMILGTMTGKVLHQSDIDEDRLGRITFSPDGKLVAAGGDWMVHVWKVGVEKAAWRFDGHLGSIESLAFSPDSKRLASASEDSTVLVWNLTRER
jgi:WD40 repeat protein